MTAPTGAFVMKNATVTIEATQYANQCRVARLKPEQDTQTYRTLVPDGIVQDVDTPAWTLELSGIQDMRTGAPKGLARLLFDMQGQEIDLILEPKAGTVPGWTIACIAKAPEIGGEQGDWATFEVELPCIGAPIPDDTP